MHFNQIEFGKRVQECRTITRMTQDELAFRTDVDKLQISRVERGARACSIDLLLDISNVLQVSTEYLLKGPESLEGSPKDRLISVITQLLVIVQHL